MQRRRAFTLIEILVVVAIIALLVAILLPSLSRARETTRRLTCTSNVHQLALSATMYAMQHPRQHFIPIGGTGGYDGLRYLYPTYVRSFNLAVCPNTKNVVRRPADLDDNASGRDDDRGGHSYESRAWMYRQRIFNGKRIVGDSVDPTANPFPKSIKNINRPAQVCMLSDCDDDDIAGTTNNWPDPQDNHGVEGVSVGYCDGHATFVRTGRPLMSMFLSGYYDPGFSSSSPIYQKYNVTVTTTSDGFRDFRW